MSTFIFDTDMCNAMNERIAKVVVGGTVALTAVDFAAGKNFSKKLLSVCNDLLRELARNDDNIVLNSSCKNVREVSLPYKITLFTTWVIFAVPANDSRSCKQCDTARFSSTNHPLICSSRW